MNPRRYLPLSPGYNLLVLGLLFCNWLALLAWPETGPDGRHEKLCDGRQVRPSACDRIPVTKDMGRIEPHSVAVTGGLSS